MAMAIICYVADSDLRLARGNAARQVIEDKFSLDRMVDRYLEVYDRVAGQSEQTGSQR
jgi:glycosyltransferase involved in cell wall biosynthesis